MKNLSLPNFIVAAAALTITTICISSCTKVYKADPNNGYHEAANPPTNTSAPILFSFNPAVGLPNTVITITGNNFSPNIGNNSATVDGVPATINSVTATQMVLTVPATASTGRIMVNTGGTVLTSTIDFKVTSATMSTYADLGANYIEHLAFDLNGYGYGDNTNKILKISPAGQVSTFVGTGSTNVFGFIWGIAVNTFGDVYVPDADKHVVYRASAQGIVSAYAGNGADLYLDGATINARFSAPRAMAIDQAGNLYVSDSKRVRKISTSGVVTTLAGSAAEGSVDGQGAAAQFGNIDDIAVDRHGNVYVTDPRYLKVRKITADGMVTTLAGTGAPGFTDGPGNIATFTNPRGIAVDTSGNVFVTDENKAAPYHAIRVINKFGVVSTLIKGTSNTGVINGPAATASVNSPHGLTFDQGGNLYIVNTGANIISKVVFK